MLAREAHDLIQGTVMRKFLYAAFFCTGLFLALSSGYSQGVRGNSSSRVFPLTPEEAARRWAEFSATRPAADYCFAFILEHKPRRGESRDYEGLIWGTAGDVSQANTRISLRDKATKEPVEFLILGNSGKPEIYRFKGGKTEKLETTQWLSPLMEGLIYSPFDVLMPFKTWPSSYFGPGRVARAVHFYDLKAPENFSGADISKIRVALSREFNAPFQTEFFDKNGDVSRVLSLGSVKKFDEKWIVKELEMFDKNSRDRDSIKIVSAKFLKEFPEGIFDVKTLSKTFEAPDGMEDL